MKKYRQRQDRGRRIRFLQIISIILAAILGMAVFAACSGEPDPDGKERPGTGEAQNLQIVATIFPEADWIRNILGENPAGAQVITLMDSGVDPHSFQATTEDIMTVSSCDVFVYVGGESDAWVQDALKEAVNPEMITVNLLEALGESAREEEMAEGMQQDRGKIDLPFPDEEGSEMDEHVWLSLRNASILCGAIEEAIVSADPAHEELYRKNLQEYRAKLSALDKKYVHATAVAPLHTLIFGDRFPFRYLTEDYGLEYYAAFAGCSAETEASFETIRFLAAKLDEMGLPAVCVLESSGEDPDHRIAETIIRSTKSRNQEILVMDSMQSITASDVKEGVTYLSAMKKNLHVLRRALGAR